MIDDHTHKSNDNTTRAAMKSIDIATEGDAVRAEEQDGTVKLANAVVIVPPNDSARPVHTTELPMVIPESSMTFPTKKELAPRVVA